MSTKTTFKRVALATVAVMGFGLLSVAPASAADVQGTFAYGTLPTANVAAGGTFTVPITYAATTTGTDSVGDKWIVKASVTGPTNATFAIPTASTTGNLVAAAESTVAAAVGTGNTTTTGPSLTVTNVAGATIATTVIGSFSFVATTAGAYTMTITATVAQSDPAGEDAATVTVTDATLEVQISGASLVQAQTGLGTGTGTQVTGRSSAAVFCVPAASTAASRYTVTAVGANITGANNGADQADAVNASSYNTVAGIVQNTANSFATGFTFEGQRTTNVASLDAGVNDCFIVRFVSDIDGPATVTARLVDPVTGVATSIGAALVTFGAATAVSASRSEVFMGAGNARPATLETTAIRLPSTVTALTDSLTSGATIAVNVKDATGAAIVGQAISATITGAGLITLATANPVPATGTTGAVRTQSLTATAMAGLSAATIGVSADGTRGVGTITITAGGVTIATKTVTFYGAVATLTATQGVSIMRSGRTAASDVDDFTLGGVDEDLAATSATGQDTATNITLVAKDADGNVVPLAANPTAVISDAAVIGAANVVSCAGQAATTVCAAGAGYYLANTIAAIGGVSGAAATVTFRTPNPAVAGAFISTAALPFTLGGTKTGGTVTMTLDKTTYEPGERMVVTYTAKDAAGNSVHDWATVATPSSNKAIVGLSGGIFVGGKEVIGDVELVYAPVSPGAFTLTLGTGTATGATITATATVGDDAATTAAAAAGDAAAEATDAANAATDAANAAAEAADAATAAAQDAADAVAALATQVAELVNNLRRQITSLTNLVIKIQKKVNA